MAEHPTAKSVKILREFIAAGGLEHWKEDIRRLSKEVDPDEHKDPMDDEDAPAAIPLRLRFYGPIGFYVNTGDDSFDQDHRGYCSPGYAWENMTEEEIEEEARRMLDEILEQAAEDDIGYGFGKL